MRWRIKEKRRKNKEERMPNFKIKNNKNIINLEET